MRFGAETDGVLFIGAAEDEGRLFCLAGVVRTTDRAEVTDVECSGLCTDGNAEGGAVIRRSAFDGDCIVFFFPDGVEGTGIETGLGMPFERVEFTSPYRFGGTMVVTPLTSLAREAVEYARGLLDVVERLEMREGVSDGGLGGITRSTCNTGCVR